MTPRLVLCVCPLPAARPLMSRVRIAPDQARVLGTLPHRPRGSGGHIQELLSGGAARLRFASMGAGVVLRYVPRRGRGVARRSARGCPLLLGASPAWSAARPERARRGTERETGGTGRGERPSPRARSECFCVDCRGLTCVDNLQLHAHAFPHTALRGPAPTRRINRELRLARSHLGTVRYEGRSSAAEAAFIILCFFPLSASPSLHLPALFRQPGSPHDQARRVRLSDALHQRVAGVLWAREGCRPGYGGAAGASCTFVFRRAGLLHARVHLMRRHHGRLHHPWDRVGHTCVLLDDAVV